jgi:hypothetical protein
MGKREPNWVTVQRLAAALGLSCEAFTDPHVVIPTQTDETPRRPGRPRKGGAQAAPEGFKAGQKQARKTDAAPANFEAKKRRPKRK